MTKEPARKMRYQDRGLLVKDSLCARFGTIYGFGDMELTEAIIGTGISEKSRKTINNVTEFLRKGRHVTQNRKNKFLYVNFKNKIIEPQAVPLGAPKRDQEIAAVIKGELTLPFYMKAESPNIHARGRLVLDEYTQRTLDFLMELEQLLVKYGFDVEKIGGT